MYRINEKQFYHYLNQFCEMIRSNQNNDSDSTELSFSEGVLREQEWYKHEIAERAHKILDAESWYRSDVGSGIIASKVKVIFDTSLQNIVDWREVQYVFEIMNKNLKRTEIVLFNIFCDGEEEDSFNAAIDLFGNRYPLITYLFFVKDPESYVPVKPEHFKERFDLLGFSTNSLSKCTWRNYTEFLDILKWVKNAITPYFKKVTLLDAHSFVWMMWMLDKPQGSPEWFRDKAKTPDMEVFCENSEKLREKFIDKFSPEKLSKMSGEELIKQVFGNRPSSMMQLLMIDDTYRSFVAAGNYKYLQVVYQGLDGEWYYKESTHPDKLTVQAAE